MLSIQAKKNDFIRLTQAYGSIFLLNHQKTGDRPVQDDRRAIAINRIKV